MYSTLVEVNNLFLYRKYSVVRSYQEALYMLQIHITILITFYFIIEKRKKRLNKLTVLYSIPIELLSEKTVLYYSRKRLPHLTVLYLALCIPIFVVVDQSSALAPR